MYSAIVEIRVGHLESPRRKKNGCRSYFRLLAACLPCLIYQLLVHKSQSSLFKAPLLDPASPACFLKFLFHLPSPLLLFLFHPLLRYFRQFPLFHSMLVAYVQTALRRTNIAQATNFEWNIFHKCKVFWSLWGNIA